MRFLCIIAVLMGAASHAHADAKFVFSNAKGPHAVGLRVVHQYDLTRSYRGPTDPVTGKPQPIVPGRPIQTLVWYPAAKAGTAVRYMDYLRLSATEETFDKIPTQIDTDTDVFVKQRSSGLSAQDAAAATSRPMWASRDAVPAAGRFPVVIYAPSLNAPAYENADLCEYLASQGYVVIASPAMGPRSREMPTDVEGIETQAADIAFLIGYAATLPQADVERLAVAGFSFGGISNVFAAAKDNRIDALVSFDGSVRFFPNLIAEAKYVTPARLTAPLLLLTAKPELIEDFPLPGLDKSTSFIGKMKYADVHRVTMKQMVHMNFASLFVGFMPDAGFDEYSREEVMQSYSWSARYTLAFLDAYLKENARGRAFLANTPATNGVPLHLLNVNTRRSEGEPPTREALAAELAKQGFDQMPKAYAAFKSRDPAFQITETDLNGWGYNLLSRGDNKAAIAVLKQATVLYPTSGNAFDSLAEAYEINKDKALAIENYKASLMLDPSNTNAAAHLKALGVGL